MKMYDLAEKLPEPSVVGASGKHKPYYPSVNCEDVEALAGLKVGSTINLHVVAEVEEQSQRDNNESGKKSRTALRLKSLGLMGGSPHGSMRCPDCNSTGDGTYCRHCGTRLRAQKKKEA